VRYNERLIAGMGAVGALAFCVGTKVDDALGHDGRSLAIGLAVALLVGAVLSGVVVLWARKAES
jgi:hypothetical protein